MKDLGKRLKSTRKAQGFSRVELAHLSGISVRSIEEIENKRRAGSLPTVQLLAAVLKVKPGWLAYGEES